MSVLEAFDRYDDLYGEATPNTGHGFLGWWPPAEVYAMDLVGYELIDNVRFTYFTGSKKAGNVKRFDVEGQQAIQFKFHFEDEKGTHEPCDINDRPIVLVDPSVVKKIPKDNRFQAQKEYGRLAGHLQTILGEDPESGGRTGNIKEDLQRLDALLQDIESSGEAFSIMVDVRWRKNKDTGVLFQDVLYCRECLTPRTAPSAEEYDPAVGAEA